MMVLLLFSFYDPFFFCFIRSGVFSLSRMRGGVGVTQCDSCHVWCSRVRLRSLSSVALVSSTLRFALSDTAETASYTALSVARIVSVSHSRS